uniref:Uncharacterized protein n=1 Tax=Odontella aurita TaxID=265563 RepID=A0A7S4I4G3_9STRA|mmetsp:Transcript_1983/g.5238  ORF Transcript_1983/g.5238 Transcript_1983/m.5238 type:complete len:195 (+) Transcript_1983:852-1436(+)
MTPKPRVATARGKCGNIRVTKTRMALPRNSAFQESVGCVLAGKIAEGGSSPTTKTGRPVLEVLQEKHLDTRIPNLEGEPECSAFKKHKVVPEAVPLDFLEENFKWLASKPSGSAGACKAEALEVHIWLMRFGCRSEKLREELACWADWMDRTSPLWSAHRAIMTCHLIALDKFPGVPPVGIGEIICRLLVKTVL